MAQHDDLIINDQAGSDFLPDLNSILTAILTQNSGNDEPPVKVPFMYWAETDADTLWQRNAANDGWINRGSLASGFGALALLNTVGTSQIAGKAVTLAKLAGGTAGKILGFNGSGDPAELDLPTGGITLGTPVATTSGTSIDFTGIPSGIKRITINFEEVSISSISVLLIQIGDSGGLEVSGYACESGNYSGVGGYTTGFGVVNSAANSKFSGSLILTLLDATTFTWAASGNLGDPAGGQVVSLGGSKSLSAELDRLRLTTLAGTPTFDNGKVNISYE